MLRDLGGLSAVVEAGVEKEIAGLRNNPRIDEDRRLRLARGLRDISPDARAQVQTYLSSVRFVTGAHRSGPVDSDSKRSEALGPSRRAALSLGSHAEVRLVAERLRLHGRVDLLTISEDHVEIVDFKTGAEGPEHGDQLHFYALLWQSDVQSNPREMPVAALTAAYRDHSFAVAPPTTEELAELAADVVARIDAADRELVSGEPRPAPSEDTCHRCTVRQLCGAYWREIAPDTAKVADGAWFDLQAVVGAQHGPHSWWLGNDAGDAQDVLLRSSATRQTFATGERVRILGLRREGP